MTARRTAAVVIGSVLVVVSGFALLWSAVSTSTAQISASTSGSAFFTAGTVELRQPGTTVSLLFNADGLYPGRVVTSCVVVAYEGSIPAAIRLHAARSGGTGLEEEVELRLSARQTGTCPDDPASSDPTDRTGGTEGSDGTAAVSNDEDAEAAAGSATPIFRGRLGDLWRAHPDYARGLVLAERATDGERLVLDAEVEMIGGNEAQGLTTEFSIVIEARP